MSYQPNRFVVTIIVSLELRIYVIIFSNGKKRKTVKRKSWYHNLSTEERKYKMPDQSNYLEYHKSIAKDSNEG
jgi:hypothetical protein